MRTEECVRGGGGQRWKQSQLAGNRQRLRSPKLSSNNSLYRLDSPGGLASSKLSSTKEIPKPFATFVESLQSKPDLCSDSPHGYLYKRNIRPVRTGLMFGCFSSYASLLGDI